MTRKRILLALSAVVFMLLANMRPVFAVGVAGGEAEGRYGTEALLMGALSAGAAAEEIARGAPELPKLELRVGLSLLPPEGGAPELGGRVLEQTGGVCTAWEVYAGGTFCGSVSDPSVLGELVAATTAQSADERAVTVLLEDEPRLLRVFTFPAALSDPMALSRELRAATRVVSCMADGSVIYG